MQEALNVTLVQTDIQWMKPEKNLIFLEKELQNLQTDLIVLPEMFNTGFCMEPHKIAETMSGLSVTWMKKMSKQLNTAICGSITIKEDEQYFNRFVFIEPHQTEIIYDKKHLFTYGGEHKVFSAGTQNTTIDYKGFKIKPFICYDLRFPVWSRNSDNYDIAIYVANWPAKRAYAWHSLLTARAIENMCYVIAVNRLGIDGNNLRYDGNSKVIDPLGNIVTDCKNVATMRQLNIFKAQLTKARNEFQFLEDQDIFKII